QARIDTLTAELPSKFPARDEAIKWDVISPDAFATATESRLVLQPDNALLATAANPPKDTYVVEAEVSLDGVSAFRLEVLTDPSLPKNGPGRHENGNFVLSQFKVEHADPGEDVVSAPTRIKLDRAEADFSQTEFDVAKAIDDTIDKGWAISGSEGTPRTAAFYTPEKLAGKRKLIFTLRQQHKDHTLGKFRLSVGRMPPPLATPPTPQERESFLALKQTQWEESVAPKSVNWAILNPCRFTRRHDATITKLDDKSLLFTGDNFYREEYKLEYDTDAKHITALRLEVLPHPDLPKGGPGRDPAGGGLLSELTAIAAERKPAATQPSIAATTQPASEPVTPPVALASAQASASFAALAAAPAAQSAAQASTANPAPPATQAAAAPATQPVEFISASADASADTVARAIDGKADSHWSVVAGAARTAVFKLKSPLAGFEGGTTLKLAMLQNQFSEISLGRLRIAVSTDPKAGEASGLPDDVERIVLTPREQRTPEQTARLRQHFLATSPLLAAQNAEIAAVQASMPGYTTTLVMTERAKPRVTRIHHRGEFLQPAEPVEAGTLAALPAFPKDQPKNRLTFAKWLMNEENPLVARVVMNRVWTRYFGRGIVNSVEDFGIMGEQPSHPELLDWLATQFVREHWSMKSMHRLIVTSATYRQASRITPELKEKDPENVWLARGPRFRVEAEVIRDIALASAGLLSEKIGGPSVYPPQPPGISELSYVPIAWNESAGADRYRRGMYTFLRRTAMYPGVTTFDAPPAEVVCARRLRSNTPLQALTTLNDTVFVEAAQALARRVVEQGPNDPTARAAEVFRLCVARKPDATELRKIVEFYQAQLKRFREDKSVDAAAVALASPGQKPPVDCDLPELAAWTTVARSVLNLDETVTKE
ncbi:MAG: DUF1553 domain-containing protein, partial [Tepidisphaeraceae bacterium]